jgi:hypothetical protein
MPKSDDDVPIFGTNSHRAAHLEDSDDDKPLFGPNGLAEKIRRISDECSFKK